MAEHFVAPEGTQLGFFYGSGGGYAKIPPEFLFRPANEVPAGHVISALVSKTFNKNEPFIPQFIKIADPTGLQFSTPALHPFYKATLWFLPSFSKQKHIGGWLNYMKVTTEGRGISLGISIKF